MSNGEVITAEEFWLEQSSQRDTWGFAYAYKLAVQSTLLSLHVPAWMARPWCINLNAFRWPGDGGAAPNPPLNAAAAPAYEIGPDGQVQSLYTIANDPITGVPQLGVPLRCRMEWGVGGAMERCYLDYPATGGAFQVTAADLRLYLEAGTNLAATLPMISGFVLPGHVSHADGQWESRPTLTCNVFGLPLGQTARVAVPPRAQAYRAYEQNNGAQSNGLGEFPTLEQAGGLTIPQIYRTDQNGTVAPTIPSIASAQAQNVWPLDPRTQSILLTNTSAVSAFDYTLSFLLDLGG